VDKSKSMFDDFGTCSKLLRSPTDSLAVTFGSSTQYLGVSDSRTTVSVEPIIGTSNLNVHVYY